MKKIALLLMAFLCVPLLVCESAWPKGEAITLVVENVYPPGHSRLGEKAVIGMWLDAVEKNSKGKIRFERHWAGEPVPSKETLDHCCPNV